MHHYTRLWYHFKANTAEQIVLKYWHSTKLNRTNCFNVLRKKILKRQGARAHVPASWRRHCRGLGAHNKALTL